MATGTTVPIAARMTAHHGDVRRGEAGGEGEADTISFSVSITDLTTRAAWMVGLAVVALLFAGWRKTARATPRPPRVRRAVVGPAGFEVSEVEAPYHRRTPVWRKVWSIAGTTVITVVLGAALATVIGFSAAWTVTTLTELLKK
jgi:hypothetical protein